MRSRDLDEVAEHVVVPDLECFHPGLLGILLLERRDDFAALVTQGPGFVEIVRKSSSDIAAVAGKRGKLVIEGLAEIDLQFRRPGEILGGGIQKAWRRFGFCGEQSGGFTCAPQTVSDCAKITRPPALKAQARKGAGHIRSAAQR